MWSETHSYWILTHYSRQLLFPYDPFIILLIISNQEIILPF